MEQMIGGYDFSGQHVLVAGLGKSGESVAQLLRQAQVDVTTYDQKKPTADVSSAAEIPWEKITLVVTSPAFPPFSDFLQEAARRSLPIWSEVEFAWNTRTESTQLSAPAPWIGITGTDGKTTTTEMIHAILQANGFNAPAVGNIGVPVSQSVQDASADHFVVELSSFALHYTQSLQLDVAVWTNVSQDHLDWHGGFENYAHDKSTVFQRARHAIIFNAEDPVVSAYASKAEVAAGCVRVGFTTKAPGANQIGVEGGWVVDRSSLHEGIEGAEDGRIIRLSSFADQLKRADGSVYTHLLEDALAAIGAALAQHVSLEAIRHALASFTLDPHRIELVASYVPEGVEAQRAIRFIDDSKATDILAAQASLAAFPDKSVIWVCGGLAKGATFEQLVAQFAPKMKKALVLGRDKAPFTEALQHSHIPYEEIDPSSNPDRSQGGAEVMARVVEEVGKLAQPGDVVLLAPAAASMDEFLNYVDRGNQFAHAAQAWVAQRS